MGPISRAGTRRLRWTFKRSCWQRASCRLLRVRAMRGLAPAELASSLVERKRLDVLRVGRLNEKYEEVHVERAVHLRRAGAATLQADAKLRAMAVDFPEVAGHPNRLAFEGCLTLVDVPSDKAPSGARGHRVVLTKAAAEMHFPVCWNGSGLQSWMGMDTMRARSAALSLRRIWRALA